MTQSLEKTNKTTETFFKKALVEIQTLAKTDVISGMETSRIKPFLIELQSYKHDDIEMYFAADSNGNAPNSFGKVQDISNKIYFKKVFSDGENFISDPVTSRVSSQDIMVITAPVKRGNRVIGIVGATILTDLIKGELKGTDVATTEQFMIVSDDGKIIFHNNSDYLNKIIGKDIIDDGRDFINTDIIIDRDDYKLMNFSFSGTQLYAMKSKILILNHNLIRMIEKSEFHKGLNSVLIQISLALLIILGLVYLVIRRITFSITRSIGSISQIFKAIANGDLTITVDDYVPDEFGDLIILLRILVRRLNGIIHSIIESSRQLFEASSELSKTSQNLSANAENQAASIEESTAALEETYSSIEIISEYSEQQSNYAKETYASMENLKKIIQEISSYAQEALTKASASTIEAEKGNDLMQNTIMGMNNIDSSTKKISEFVSMISDISDQVNLLALNAAIEAARAGEHGKGFAVVADEIGNLADKTSDSAKNITNLVNSGLKEVISGMKYVDQTLKSLYNIIKNIQQTDNLVGNIADSSKVQTDASDEVLNKTQKVIEAATKINHATEEQMLANKEIINTINSINEATQDVAKGAATVAASSEEISAQSESLYSGIKFFKAQMD